MRFLFTNEHTSRRADEIVDYLRGPRLWVPSLDYPDYLDWTGKVHAQLKAETKRAMLCYDGRWLAGAIVYQRHGGHDDVLEIKNITVRPNQQGRYVASFLLRQVEIEGALEFGSRSVVIDAKAGNVAIRRFLLHHRYAAVGQTDLYGLGTGEDTVFRKRLSALGA